MINQEELVICRKRGHKLAIDSYWEQCPLCGMWLRERRIVDEQEADPPEAERGPIAGVRALRAKFQGGGHGQ